MKQFIKDGKVYNSPVMITVNGRNLYSNSEEYLAKFGYSLYVVAPVQKTVEQQIKESDNQINKVTDEKILNEFTFADQEIYLSQENQMNFTNMYLVKDKLQYPQTIKTKTGYFELYSAEDVEYFYLSGVNYIKECLEECWAQKQQAAALISAEYEASLSGVNSGAIE